MDLSVIICTRNRADSLSQCLAAVQHALLLCSAKCEIVIVDNGSTDRTQQVITDFTAHSPIKTQIVQETKPGVARARNAGLRAAQGRLFAFTDDDCRPEPDYYAKLVLHTATEGKPAMIGGRVILGDDTDMPYGLIERTIAERWQLNTADDAYGRNVAAALIGANMAMHREIINNVGLFDERYGAGGLYRGGEDIDYLYRVYLAGYPVIYAPDMVIRHFHGRKTLAAIHQHVGSYDRGDGALYAKYLFRAPWLLRPLIWDFKKAVKEFSGGPLCWPDMGISHWQRLWWVTRGMIDYFLTTLKYSVLGNPRL